MILKELSKTWKSFTARRINQLLRRTGQLWEKESYDHIIRSEKEYWFQIDYVWNNPEKAGLTNCLRWKVAGTGVVAGADGSSKEQSPEASM